MEEINNEPEIIQNENIDTDSVADAPAEATTPIAPEVTAEATPEVVEAVVETEEVAAPASKKLYIRYGIALAVILIAVVVLLISCGKKPEKGATGADNAASATTAAPDTDAQELTDADSTLAPDTSEPTEAGTDAPDTEAPSTDAPDTDNPSGGNTTGGSTEGGATGGNTTGGSENNGSSYNGNLSATGSYEGAVGTGKYNYGEALQKAILFYELQRSGKLPANKRTNWRGDSGLKDGSDVGLDLTGGLYDAGDNVKFNLPMAYTATVLSMAIYENGDAIKKSGQLDYLKDSIKWIDDYLIKCHPKPHVYYYQVGDGNLDHGWWGPAEVMQMNRPAYSVTDSAPGSTVVAEAAAALASGYIVFKDSDPAYAGTCLSHAKSLYEFAESTKSDAGYTAANGFYNSWSGYQDELSWAAAWLYLATKDNTYLTKAKNYWNSEGNYKWTLCWDDKNTGATLLLYQITGEKKYGDWMEKNLSWWSTGYNGEKVTYSPKGLAILDVWGTLRYATTAAFIAEVYSSLPGVDAKKAATYKAFAEGQLDYALGSSGRSYEVGFGVNPPKNPHHRTAQGSYCDNMNEPSTARHTLYGALVGGPDSSDGYQDTVSDYTKNEVACDYNAGFVGALSYMYGTYGGQTIANFGAIEKVTVNEIYAEGGVNVTGNDFLEVKAYIYNTSAWPARVVNDAELRYYVDLSEIYSAGKTAADVTISTNYSSGTVKTSLVCVDEAKHLYYVSVDMSGTLIYPGGQSSYKKEVQFRMSAPSWDNSNDPSYADLKGNNGSSMVALEKSGLYAGGKLVFGTEMKAGSGSGTVIPSKPSGGSQNNNSGDNNQNQSGNQSGNQNNNQGSNQNAGQSGPATATSADIELSSTGNTQPNGNTIALNLTLTNKSNGSIDLSKLEILYYFTKDGGSSVAECDYACMTSGGNYAALSGVTGTMEAVAGKTGADTVCKIKLSGSTVIDKGGTYTVQLRIHKSDWSNYNTSDDYSGKDIKNIVIKYDGKTIFGTQP